MYQQTRNQTLNAATRVSYFQYMVLLLCCLTLSACDWILAPNIEAEVTELRGGEYQIDPKHSALLFKVQHFGLSTYVGRFNSLNATLDFNPDDPGNMQLQGYVETASVDSNDPELEKNLRGGDWLNVEAFPQAHFRSNSVRALGENRFEISGVLTLVGIELPVVLNARFNGGANNILTGRYTLGFEAQARISRSAFGLDKYPTVIGDEIALEFYAEFQRQ